MYMPMISQYGSDFTLYHQPLMFYTKREDMYVSKCLSIADINVLFKQNIPKVILVCSWWNMSMWKIITVASFFGQYTFHLLPLLGSPGDTVLSFLSQQAWLSVGQWLGSTTADLSSQKVHAEQLAGFCFKLVCTELLCTAVYHIKFIS